MENRLKQPIYFGVFITPYHKWETIYRETYDWVRYTHLGGSIRIDVIAMWRIKPTTETIGERMARRGLIYNYKTNTYTDPAEIIS